MATAGTLLEDLGSAQGTGNPSDDDLVNRIFAEMNGPTGGNSMTLPPAPSARAMAGAQLPPVNSTATLTMDPGPVTAHMIGNQHPTPADFAQVMHGGAPMMYPPVQQGAGAYNFAPPPPPQQTGIMGALGINLGKEFKTPLLVAIIVLVMSLPMINTMIGMYLPSLLRMGGDLTTLGLVAKGLLGGALFWVLQRVIAPLI